MMLSGNFFNKVNRIRKQNWSAPTIMSTFIFVSMMIIFSFETLGLTNKDKNLELRSITPEKRIYLNN
jgi:hypothetical protein